MGRRSTGKLKGKGRVIVGRKTLHAHVAAYFLVEKIGEDEVNFGVEDEVIAACSRYQCHN